MDELHTAQLDDAAPEAPRAGARLARVHRAGHAGRRAAAARRRDTGGACRASRPHGRRCRCADAAHRAPRGAALAHRARARGARRRLRRLLLVRRGAVRVPAPAAASSSGPARRTVIGTGVTEAFFTKLKVSFIAAIFVASPVIFYQAWRFVAPGLYESEKRLALPFAVAASFFFIARRGLLLRGRLPGRLPLLPRASTRSIGVAPQLRISEYLSFTSRMLLAFGVTFELPVVTFFLARLGVVTHRHLIGWIRYAILAIFVVAAGPDARARRRLAAPHGGAAPGALRREHRRRLLRRAACGRGGRGRRAPA